MRRAQQISRPHGTLVVASSSQVGRRTRAQESKLVSCNPNYDVADEEDAFYPLPPINVKVISTPLPWVPRLSRAIRPFPDLTTKIRYNTTAADCPQELDTHASPTHLVSSLACTLYFSLRQSTKHLR